MAKEEFICKAHLSDPFLKDYILQNSSRNKCKYCNKVVDSISIDGLADYMEKCIEIEYDDPYAQGAPYDSEEVYYENRFPGIDVYMTEEVLEKELEIDYDDDWQVIQDISSHFGNSYWSLIDGMWGPSSD